MLGGILAVPILQPCRDLSRIILGAAGPNRPHDAHRQLSGPVILHQLFVYRGGIITGFSDQNTRLKVGGDAFRRGLRQR